MPEVVRQHNRDFASGAQHGVEIKEWVRAIRIDHGPWLAKAGNLQLGDVGTVLNEAIVPHFYRTVGIAANQVAVGCRNLSAPTAQRFNPMLVSFHQYRSGYERAALGPNPNFSADYWADFATMRALDVALGQTDRHMQNYMVMPDGNLFVIDCGRSMSNAWSEAALETGALETIKGTGAPEAHAWSIDDTRLVTERMELLTDATVDNIFEQIPRVWRRLYEASLDPSFSHQARSLDQRRADLKARLGALRGMAWEVLILYVSYDVPMVY